MLTDCSEQYDLKQCLIMSGLNCGLFRAFVIYYYTCIFYKHVPVCMCVCVHVLLSIFNFIIVIFLMTFSL